jgi:hypothetical protein
VTRLLLAAQGGYYVLTGLWPLVSMDTFEAVSGPKTDDWLVKTVGVLALAIGLALLYGARRERPARESYLLAALSAAGFAGVDLVYGGGGRISRVYLADAAAEIVFLASAVVGFRSRGPERGRT